MHNLQNGRIEDKPIPITWEFDIIKEFEALEQAIDFATSKTNHEKQENPLNNEINEEFVYDVKNALSNLEYLIQRLENRSDDLERRISEIEQPLSHR